MSLVQSFAANGPKLVMIHGWAMQSAMFDSLIERWRESAHLHLVDLPGHGRSRESHLSLVPMQNIVDELHETIGPDAIWLGWSMGGLFAQQAVSDPRFNAKALIALSTSPCFAEKPDWPYGLKASVLNTMRDAVKTNPHQTVRDFLRLEVLGASRQQASLEMASQLAFEHGDPMPAALEQGLDVLEQTDLRKEISQLAIPNLWIGGSRDRLVSPDALNASAALNPQGEATVLQGAGHAAFISSPDSLIARIEQFGMEHELGLV